MSLLQFPSADAEAYAAWLEDAKKLNRRFGYIVWHEMEKEEPKFVGAGTVRTCITETERHGVKALDWTKDPYAKTERGQAPRWQWRGKNNPWSRVVRWAYLPEAPV